MGTPAFMAPEQARGRWDEVDARTDLWAVGATLFALLSGRFVHRAKTLNEQFFVAMTSVAPKLRTLLPDLPVEVATVVDRALEFRPEDRWQDARSMQAAIRKAYASARGVRPDANDGVPFLSARSVVGSLAATGESEAVTSTDVMKSLGLGTPATPTIEQGVTHAPSAAPDRRGTGSSTRRSPVFVGLGAGAIGIALALAALVHRPIGALALEATRQGSSSSLATSHSTMEVGAPIIRPALSPVSEALDAGAHAVVTIPSPPATGVPLSMSVESPPPKRHISQASASAAPMPANGALMSPASLPVSIPVSPAMTSPAVVSSPPSAEVASPPSVTRAATPPPSANEPTQVVTTPGSAAETSAASRSAPASEQAR